jgi:UDP-2-acetamido-3-amino-2,3-dideoxy-glucuronate N-acetyltransferase
MTNYPSEDCNFYGKGSAPDSTSVGAFCDIGSEVGGNSKVQTHVSIPPGWTLGDNVFYGPGCRFANDNKPNIKKTFAIEYGTVENDVVIGMGALIGAGVTLGEGCVIGMGAVVTKDVPPNETWIGNPAHRI